MNFLSTVDDHLPDILTGVGIAGWLGATILAVHKTPEALKCIADKKKELGKDKLTVKETVKATWKCYISPSITALAATVCIVSANSVNAGRNATLAAALGMSNTALKEYQDKVKEVVGEEKKAQIDKEVIREKVAKTPVDIPKREGEEIIIEDGVRLCCDAGFNRYFYATPAAIRQAEVEANRDLYDKYSEGGMSLNDWWGYLGLASKPIGEEYGFSAFKNYIDLIVDDSAITPDGRKCWAFSYRFPPELDYDR